ncbi:hypothetical protein RXV94_09190 [Yeosuana sp. MJ-SS3]|uniref:Uncharacterized protein n=1 Tax=Gilvirhabdus luticola TaxID=3079858 RepID=A0ABU3U7E7_9FLAO|nr:hypothetical protein [Yeosuana sp. MJ-SS3]MDU8886333.1 hypothetical protein [Yeosuana sp. MJ-SS3]
MKKKLNKMNYPEFIEYLENKGIKYIQNKEKVFESLHVKVIPRSKKHFPRTFDLYSQKQLSLDAPEKKSTLDLLNYQEYIEFLNFQHIEFKESRYVDDILSNIIDVSPINGVIERRIFFANSEDQVFDGDYVEF